MKLSLLSILAFSIQSLFSIQLIAITITCNPLGYDSKGEGLNHLNIKINENGLYETMEDWKIPGILKHKGRVYIAKAGNEWLKIEFLQEDSYFPKTRGFMRVNAASRAEAFVTDYTALFSNDESAYVWKSKKIACILN